MTVTKAPAADPVTAALEGWKTYISTFNCMPDECFDEAKKFSAPQHQDVEKWFRETYVGLLDTIKAEKDFFLGDSTSGPDASRKPAVVESLMWACEAVLNPGLYRILFSMQKAVNGYAAGAAPVDVLGELVTEDAMTELRQLLENIALRYKEFEAAAKRWTDQGNTQSKSLAAAETHVNSQSFTVARDNDAVATMDKIRKAIQVPGEWPKMTGPTLDAGPMSKWQLYLKMRDIVRMIDFARAHLKAVKDWRQAALQGLREIQKDIAVIKRMCIGPESDLNRAIHDAISFAIDTDETERRRAAWHVQSALAKLAEIQALATKQKDGLDKISWSWTSWTLDDYVKFRFRKQCVLGAAHAGRDATKHATMAFVSEGHYVLDCDTDVDHFSDPLSMVLLVGNTATAHVEPEHYLFVVLPKSGHCKVPWSTNNSANGVQDIMRVNTSGPFFGKMPWGGDKDPYPHGQVRDGSDLIRLVAVHWNDYVITGAECWKTLMDSAIGQGSELKWEDNVFEGDTMGEDDVYGAIYYYANKLPDSAALRVLAGKKGDVLQWPKLE